MSKSFLGQSGLPRGIRNNNVGNLVLTNIAWQGKVPNVSNTDKHFEQFKELKFGIRAMFRDLINDISKGKNTVEKLIHEYAPPHENNTQNYINQVAKALGVGAKDTIKHITDDFLLKLGRIIIRIENGNVADQYITDSDIKEGISIIGDTSGYGIQMKKSVCAFCGHTLKIVGIVGFSLFCLFF